MIIKICGITNLEDGKRALEWGASAIGFIFDPSSPRCVKPDEAGRIVEVLRRHFPQASFVGVFVNGDQEDVVRTAKRARLTHLQLHGDESPEYCATLDLPIWKVFHLSTESDIDIFKRYKSMVECFLVDSRTRALRGGTGLKADWNLAGKAAQVFPVILAGGLNPENVGEAIEKVKPRGVDVSSGVEKAPGQKDHDKLLRFFQNLRKG